MFRLHRVEFLISCIERRGEIKILWDEFDFEIQGLFAKWDFLRPNVCHIAAFKSSRLCRKYGDEKGGRG